MVFQLRLLYADAGRISPQTIGGIFDRRCCGRRRANFVVSTSRSNCYMGIMANVNDVFDLHELNVYDPAIPTSYFGSWSAATGQPTVLGSYDFCPLVTSTTISPPLWSRVRA